MTKDGPGGSHRPKRRQHPFAEKPERLDSFEEWPLAMPQKPHSLVDAGFYYTGRGDRVKCFKCGVEVYNWEDGDQPWVEHAKLSLGCSFVRDIKGEEFVKDVQRNLPVHHHLFDSQE